MSLSSVSTTLYPTTTAGQVDPNGGSYDSKQAWTSRGAAQDTAETSTAAAPSSPLLVTATAGGNFIEWFSKGVQAFTLAGPVLVQMNASEGFASANVTIGAELAVCDASGASPVVWGYTLYGLEITNASAYYQFLVAGDDVAVTAGQRLRIRFYIDDSSAVAMAAGDLGRVRYSGPTGGANGDTYLTFGQTLAELVAAPPARHPPMHLLAR
jgi:hypothetical protein